MQSGKNGRCDSTKGGRPNCFGRTLVSTANGIHKMILHVASSCITLATENDVQTISFVASDHMLSNIVQMIPKKLMIQEIEIAQKTTSNTQGIMFGDGFTLEFECTRSQKELESCRTNMSGKRCESWKSFTLYQLHVSRWRSESLSGWSSPARQ